MTARSPGRKATGETPRPPWAWGTELYGFFHADRWRMSIDQIASTDSAAGSSMARLFRAIAFDDQEPRAGIRQDVLKLRASRGAILIGTRTAPPCAAQQHFDAFHPFRTDERDAVSGADAVGSESRGGARGHVGGLGVSQRCSSSRHQSFFQGSAGLRCSSIAGRVRSAAENAFQPIVGADRRPGVGCRRDRQRGMGTTRLLPPR